ncbi:MAG: MFS transporter, partial [Desulfovibrionaceae bacterium]|nr:MFS transporter [Desulfovibrionaceae bacterium]
SWTAFLVHEKTCKTPLLPLDVYKNPRFLAAAIVSFTLGVGLFGSTYLAPLFVELVQEYTPTEAGLMLLPAGLVLGLLSPISGKLADQFPPRLLIILGLGLFCWSNLLLSGADTSTDFWVFSAWMVLSRVGLACISPALNSGAVRALKPEHMGYGAGNINFMRLLGGAVGVAVLSVYLEQQTTLYCQAFNAMQTGNRIAADALVRISQTLLKAGVYDNFSNALHPSAAYFFLSETIAAKGQMMGFRESFFLTAVVFALAIIPAWFIRQNRKDG